MWLVKPMAPPDKQLKKHFFYSLLLHLSVLSILIVSFDWSQPMPVTEKADKNSKVIDALVVDAPALPKKIIQRMRAPVVPPEPTAPPKVAPKPMEETIALPDKKAIMLKKKQLAELKKQKELVKKQKIEQKQAELQKAFEKEMNDLHAQSLQQQMLQEQKRVAAARMSGEVNKYKALILQTIGRHWLVPPNANKKRSAELLIRTAPGGAVLDVQLIKSSGDIAVDRSARAAVFKASPLPVPTAPDAFEEFRQFVLKVKPENIVSNENWLS